MLLRFWEMQNVACCSSIENYRRKLVFMFTSFARRRDCTLGLDAVWCGALVSLCVVSVFSVRAQVVQQRVSGAQATAARPAFEAASIHIVDPHSHDDPNDMSTQPQAFPANRWRMQNMTMRALVCTAYVDAKGECYLDGGARWIYTGEMRYEIIAKVEGSAMLSRDQMRPMLRTLLAERFHLKVHTEHRMLSGYAMVIAKGGSKLAVHVDAAHSSEFVSGYEIKTHGSTENLAGNIEWAVKEPVADQTGLTGVYDYDLKFAPAIAPLSDDPRFAGLPSIFTAVQEQLGLKLVRGKVPRDYTVVDGVDKIPTEN
jgi:uncharacterized protein (TIGR03435 family)